MESPCGFAYVSHHESKIFVIAVTPYGIPVKPSIPRKKTAFSLDKETQGEHVKKNSFYSERHAEIIGFHVSNMRKVSHKYFLEEIQLQHVQCKVLCYSPAFTGTLIQSFQELYPVSASIGRRVKKIF